LSLIPQRGRYTLVSGNHQSGITLGLLVWRLLDLRALGHPLRHLNPQTQETTLR
jgi:hypothetical protein